MKMKPGLWIIKLIRQKLILPALISSTSDLTRGEDNNSISYMYKIHEFLLSIGLIRKQDWGYIIIASIILTPITGIGLLFYFWIKAYSQYRKSL